MLKTSTNPGNSSHVLYFEEDIMLKKYRIITALVLAAGVLFASYLQSRPYISEGLKVFTICAIPAILLINCLISALGKSVSDTTLFFGILVVSVFLIKSMPMTITERQAAFYRLSSNYSQSNLALCNAYVDEFINHSTDNSLKKVEGCLQGSNLLSEEDFKSFLNIESCDLRKGRAYYKNSLKFSPR